MSLAEKLMKKLKQDMESITLVPSEGGVFEVEIDGKNVYSKIKTGQFPEWADVAPAFGLK